MAGDDGHNNCSWVDGDCAVKGNKAIALNTWNHIAVTKEGSTVKFYNDGSYTN